MTHFKPEPVTRCMRIYMHSLGVMAEVLTTVSSLQVVFVFFLS